MRKKIALLFCMLVMALFGFVGCNDTPYKNMSVTTSLDNTQVHQLLIEKKLNDSNQYVYEYPSMEFDVLVKDFGDASPEVVLSGWEGRVETPELYYLGGGKTKVKLKAFSENFTGPFQLKILTKEGGESTKLDFYVGLKINAFDFNKSALPATSSDSSVILEDVNNLITFEPEKTTQRNIRYSIAVPETNDNGSTYFISGNTLDNGNTVTYMMDSNYEDQYKQYRYADIVKDTATNKQKLVVYPYFMDPATNKYVVDGDGNWIPTRFPQIKEDTIVGGQDIRINCITLRAESLDNTDLFEEFLDVEIVQQAGEIKMLMRGDAITELVPINSDEDGKFHVVLMDPDYDGGLLTVDQLAYFTERDISFAVENPYDDTQKLADYIITCDNLTSTDEKPVEIAVVGDNEIFNIQSLDKGEYAHTFVMKHKKYPGIFDQEFQVVFKVKNIPLEIKVNNHDIPLEVRDNNGGIDDSKKSDYTETVYNVYSRGVYGTKFKVETDSEFGYSVILDDTNKDPFLTYVRLRRAGDGSNCVYSYWNASGVAGAESMVQSTIEGVNYTTFSNSSTFYLIHSFQNIPSDPLTLQLCIQFTAADPSYDESVCAVFRNITATGMINLNFEKSIEGIDLVQNEFSLDLNNDNYWYSESANGEINNPDSGMKIWEMPAFISYEKTVKTLEYNEELIKVYPYFDDSKNVTTLYAKFIDRDVVGETALKIETVNGFKVVTNIETYVPTIYQYAEKAPGGVMPLSVQIDTNSAAYLYSTSKDTKEDPTSLYDLYDYHGALGLQYESISNLFLLIGSEQRIKFYDYRISTVNGEFYKIPIDITSQVTVSFNYPNYATYADGIIKTYEHVTMSRTQPVVMTIRYVGGVEVEEEGVYYKQSFVVVHKINLFIYKPLQHVDILTSKAVDLYLDESLGYYNKDLAKHTIISTFIPTEIHLGSEWNTDGLWHDPNWNPVELRFDYMSALAEPVVNSLGETVVFRSQTENGKYRTVYYADLFKISVDKAKYECDVHNVLSGSDGNETLFYLDEMGKPIYIYDDNGQELPSLLHWMAANGYDSKELRFAALKEKLFNDNLSLVINVYINQFNRLQNINSVRIASKFATRIEQLKLDVDDDGVYFEIRQKDGVTYIDKSEVIINYTIDNAMSVNKDILLQNFDTASYYVTVKPDYTGNSGKIIVTPKLVAGEGNITVTPKDNIEGFVDGKYVYNNSSSDVLQAFRVKVADGSKQYPFEIQDIDDFKQMQSDLEDDSLYHYTLTRNIDLANSNIYSINVISDKTDEFGLSGKHVYFKNGEKITLFSTIYNLEINSDVSADHASLGLFGKISAPNVVLDNITIEGALIKVVGRNNSYNTSIGILAGSIDSKNVTINSCKVRGLIQYVNARTSEDAKNDVYARIGGLVGYISTWTDYKLLLTNRPESYNDGVVSTGYSSYVDIELTYDKSAGQEVYAKTFEKSADKILAGGLVGLVENAASTFELKSLEVISNLTSEIPATIGGVIGKAITKGSSAKTQIDRIEVSPKIVVNINKSAKASNVTSFVVAGAIGASEIGGDANIGYATDSSVVMSHIVVSMVDIGSQYSWKDKVNIYVPSPNCYGVVGGIIGNNVQTINNSYVRSYYRRSIDETFKGNIIVVAAGGSVGGVIGQDIDSANIENVYFDANISAHQDMNVGMLIGTMLVGGNIKTSYAIGMLYKAEVDGDKVTIKTPVMGHESNFGLIGYLPTTDIATPAEYQVQNTQDVFKGTVVNDKPVYTFQYTNANYVNPLDNAQTYKSNINATNVYGIINNGINYFMEGTKVICLYDLDSNKLFKDAYASIFNKPVNEVFVEQFGYKITYGEDANLVDFDWFYDALINTVEIETKTLAFPVVLDGEMVLYDLVPSSISIIINERVGLYNISYNEKHQVIMYINRDSNGLADSTYYDISFDADKSVFVVTLEGVVVEKTYINSNNLKLNNKVEFVENSSEGIIKIVGNRIYPVSAGTATLTIRSYVVKSVKVDIEIVVVDGFTDYRVLSGSGDKEITPAKYGIDGNLIEHDNKVYIDKIDTMSIYAINQDASKYVANSNFGFILELLDGAIYDDDGELVEGNGVIKVNGVDYQYNPDDISQNIININSRTFQMSGVQLGNVKFVITPYLNLPMLEAGKNTYQDRYVSVNEIADPTDYLDLYNVYFLDNAICNLQREYQISVRAKALNIESSKTEAEIGARNTVDFQVVLETANVLIEEDTRTDSVTKKVGKLSILEDLYVKIGRDFDAKKSLKLTSFDYVYDKATEVYTIINNTKTYFDYELINLVLDGIQLKKTNTDPLSRMNTYKIQFSMSVSFDRDFYRANANLYDLNSVVFDVHFEPETNASIQGILNVRIVPDELKTIFTNFYNRVDTKTNKYYDTEFPETNESTFIVPGREGLLKITLDEEFSNSSYITLTVNKNLAPYITLEQVAAIVDVPLVEGEVESVVGYTEVTSTEIVETELSWGIKLSKMSINYKDNNYFNKTYYVKVKLDKSVSISQLDLTVTSFKVDSNNKVTQQLKPHVCALTVYELPYISVTLDGHDSSLLGVGVRKQLDISYKGLTKDVPLNINSEEAQGKLFIQDENFQEVGSLSLDYLKQGKKYYIAVDASITTRPSNVQISFNAMEIILGSIEECRSELFVDIVDFEIAEISVMDDIKGVMTLLHGATVPLKVSITIADIVQGSEDDIKNYKQKLFGNPKGTTIAERLGEVRIAEYELAGLWLTEGSELVANGRIDWLYKTVVNDKTEYINMSLGTYGGITIEEHPKSDDSKGIEAKFYTLKGSTIGDDTFIRVDSEYYYENGKFKLGGEGEVVYPLIKEIQIIVEDNSTYDHPTPIENQTDFERACSVVGGNFILLNHITLENWTPTKAEFDTFDGNGYTITINSLNLGAVRGLSKADVGIFTEVSKETLLKNITINIAPLLKTELQMSNDISRMQASSQSSYTYLEGLDLGYTKELNFGILAGTNNGSITNAKVVSICKNDDKESLWGITNTETQKKYLHILTTLGFVGDDLVVSNIGGLVGVNSETGAITNSFVGLNKSNNQDNKFYITGVGAASAVERNNEDDELTTMQIKEFVLAGGNNIGGLVCVNNGIISNSYAKGMGVYNPFPAVGNAATSGLVVYNNNIVTSCFVEGSTMLDGTYRASSSVFVESTGYIGGLVYENNAKIENSYANIYVQTMSSFVGGFVFRNNAQGIITNSYSTAVNRNSLATGQFTGVKQGKVQNFGTFKNCYYLLLDDEIENVNEHAKPITKANAGQSGSWLGFAFVTGEINPDGIWTSKEGYAPQIKASLQDTVSFRRLSGVVDVETDNGMSARYDYEYHIEYLLGTPQNPLLIDKATNFDKYLIDTSIRANVAGTERIFGYSESSVRHVRLVNNLDFKNIVQASVYKDTYLYKMTFAGVLDGNGMTLDNLNLNTDLTGLKNFGLFAKIGHEDSESLAIIKNLNVNVLTYGASANDSAGILAGTIVNAGIINVNINGNNNVISGMFAAGALAGVIYTTNDMEATLIDVTVENVEVHATYGSLNGTITTESEDKSKHFFKSFSVTVGDRFDENSSRSFTSLYYNRTTGASLGATQNPYDVVGTKTYLETVSYAGGIAGILIGNNYKKDVGYTSSDVAAEGQKYSYYRTESEGSKIDNVVAKGKIKIETADNAGGLFGYVAENTKVHNSRLIVNESSQSLIKANNNIGGIVGELHGVLEQCAVEHDEAKQAEYDSLILDNYVERSYDNLFNKTEGYAYYVVSVGGLAGTSEDGVILDSYVKVNVIQKQAYIAGGIVGYTQGYNYIANVFNTGSVFGKFVTGGIIGLNVSGYEKLQSPTIVEQVNKKKTTYLNNVISLTDWLDSSEDLNIRDEVTKILHNNYKELYRKTGSEGYYDFHIKMPEIGNAPIRNYDSKHDFVILENGSISAQLMDKLYRSGHDSYYVGSVVGKALIENGAQIYNGTVGDKADQLHVFNVDTTNSAADYTYTSSSLESLGVFAGSQNVISATLGIVSYEGSANSGNRLDIFDNQDNKFVIEAGDDITISSISYRVQNNSTKLNYYDPLVSSEDNDGESLDKYYFASIFDAQEYRQQILGSSYFKTSTEADTIKTRNIFKDGYAENIVGAEEGTRAELSRGDATDSNGSFEMSNSHVWEVKGLLPKFNLSAVASIKQINNTDELISAFSNSKSGQTYEILQDIEYDIDSTEKVSEYPGGLKSTFVGKNINTDPSAVTPTYPTITITVESGSKIASIFNMFYGAVLQDLNFNITINMSQLDANKAILSKSYGLLANSLEGAYITNCSFLININDDISFSGASDKLKSENLGLLFGSINNSTINNSKFIINLGEKESEKTITIGDCGAVQNFGLFAGYIGSSTIQNNDFAISDAVNITIKNTYEEFSLGLIAGKLNGAKYFGNEFASHVFGASDERNISDITNMIVSDLNSHSKVTRNIGGMFGSAILSSISYNKNENNLNNSTKLKLNYVIDADAIDMYPTFGESDVLNLDYKVTGNTYNVAMLVAKTENSKIDNYIFGTKENIVLGKSDDVIYPYALSVNDVSALGIIHSNVSIGSIVGSDVKDSQIGRSGVVGSYLSINSNIDAHNVYVGGVIGSSNSAYNLVTDTFFDGKLNVVNQSKGAYQAVTDKQGNSTTKDYYVNTFVGGILGAGFGRTRIVKAVAAGDYSIKCNNEIDDNKPHTPVRAVIGGIVGYTDSIMEINSSAALCDMKNIPTHKHGCNACLTMSGILGLNKGMFMGENTYSFVELPYGYNNDTSEKNDDNRTNMNSYTVTNGTIGSSVKNVFYAQEFIENNYDSDSMFSTFGFGDLYNTISEYSPLAVLLETKDNKTGLTQFKIGSMSVVLPKNLVVGSGVDAKSYLRERVENNSKKEPITGQTKFRPLDLSITKALNGTSYYVIPSDTFISGLELGQNVYVSGRATETGKTHMMINDNGNAGSTEYAVTTNNGVLSNVYLKTGGKRAKVDPDTNETIKGADGQPVMESYSNNMALVKTNNGLVVGCYVYGQSHCNYTLIQTNNAKLYASAAAVKYVQPSDAISDTPFYGLVQNNGSREPAPDKIITAEINDCFGYSYGYTENHYYMTELYGFAEVNNGKIKNSAFYIPSEVRYDNRIGDQIYGFKTITVKDANGDVRTNKGEFVENVMYSAKPASLIESRSAVWYEENGHAQIKGIKDVDNSLVIKIFIQVEGKEDKELVKSVKHLKETIESAKENKVGGVSTPLKYTLSYTYNFYEENTLGYTVVRVSESQDFHDYVRTNNWTIGNQYMDTIMLFTNNLNNRPQPGDPADTPNKSHIININIEGIEPITIRKNAALIGINCENDETTKDEQIIVDFGCFGSEEKFMEHELFTLNEGLIADLTVQNLTLKKFNSMYSFAPISKNTGTLSNVKFNSVQVLASAVRFVSGLVTTNTKSGKLYECVIDNAYLVPGVYYNYAYTNSEASKDQTRCSIGQANKATGTYNNYVTTNPY